MYSGGERAFLLIAASIGSSEVAVNLSDALASLDRGHLDLVLAAIDHGSLQHNEVVYDADGRPRPGKLDALYPWPR